MNGQPAIRHDDPQGSTRHLWRGAFTWLKSSKLLGTLLLLTLAFASLLEFLGPNQLSVDSLQTSLLVAFFAFGAGLSLWMTRSALHMPFLSHIGILPVAIGLALFLLLLTVANFVLILHTGHYEFDAAHAALRERVLTGGNALDRLRLLGSTCMYVLSAIGWQQEVTFLSAHSPISHGLRLLAWSPTLLLGRGLWIQLSQRNPPLNRAA